MSHQSELKVLKDISDDDSINLGQYISQLVTTNLENAVLFSNAFDQFLANDKEIPPAIRLQIAIAFEETFKTISEGLQ
jgi:hypothetical protein